LSKKQEVFRSKDGKVRILRDTIAFNSFYAKKGGRLYDLLPLEVELVRALEEARERIVALQGGAAMVLERVRESVAEELGNLESELMREP
jgi:hypothetical protein